MNCNLINTENLKPYNHQKSFGGRAKVRTFAVGSSMVEILASYGTAVAAAVTTNGKTEIFRLYDEAFFNGEIEGWNDRAFEGYSATTGKHLEAFHARHDLAWCRKAEWCRKDTFTLDEVLNIADGMNRAAA